MLRSDIWERFDLSKVGKALPTKENGSKLVFTTRSIKVCAQMKVDEKIKVQCLPEEKGWELFPRIRELGHEVVKECGGLPLALVTIAIRSCHGFQKHS